MHETASPTTTPPEHDLARLGYPGRWPALLADAGDLPHGRVTRAERVAATVLGHDGPVRIRWLPTQPHPVTGDWVAYDPQRPLDGDPQLIHIAPRATEMTRPASDGGEQVLAANVDLVGVVAPIDAPLNVRRLERGVVIAYASGATPVVVLTKADACRDVAAATRQASQTAVALDVVATSAHDGRGLDAIRELLAPDRTMVLLGASGTGKSTLTNALVGAEVLATQEVRSDHKGRHTTTHRELVALPSGGALLDTPGLRTLSLGDVSGEFDLAFPEIDELAAGCRFGDCRHDGEPGCAVEAALAAGGLDPDRVEGWRRIRAESENAALRADTAAYREHTRKLGRMYRDAQSIKPPR